MTGHSRNLSAKCKVCGKPRPAVAIQHLDPYCSTACARKGHGSEGK